MPLKRTLRLARSVGATTLRRLRRGPTAPTWSWRYDLAMGVLRDLFRRPVRDLARTRAMLDATGDLEARRDRARWEIGALAGRPTLTATAPDAPATRRTVLYLHGGGYFFGSPHSHRTTLAECALASGARVVALDYRLAPEHPCPAAIEDAVAAVRALYAAGLAPGDLVLGGDSAGGGLAVATLVALRDAGDPMPAGAFLLSPWTDLTLTSPSLEAHVDTDYLGTRDGLARAAAWYLGDLPADDPRASPRFAELGGLPPLLILVGGAEILHDDSLHLATRAAEAHVRVHLHVEPDEVHCWPSLGALSPRAQAAWAQIGGFVRFS